MADVADSVVATAQRTTFISLPFSFNLRIIKLRCGMQAVIGRKLQQDLLAAGCFAYQVHGVIPVAVALPFHHRPRPSGAGGDAEPAPIAFCEIDLG